MTFQITIRDAHHDNPDRLVGNFASYDRAFQWGRSEYAGDHWIRIIEEEAPPSRLPKYRCGCDRCVEFRR